MIILIYIYSLDRLQNLNCYSTFLISDVIIPPNYISRDTNYEPFFFLKKKWHSRTVLSEPTLSSENLAIKYKPQITLGIRHRIWIENV